MKSYWNINDKVWVVGKIIEIIETEDGRSVRVEFPNASVLCNSVKLPETDIIEKEGGECVI